MMERQFGEFLISDDRNLLQSERIYGMLHTTYWASERTRETIARAIENSLCFGVYHEGEQIAFARCVTDYATTFWLADVIVDERFRGRGVGKEMVSTILSHERLRGLTGLLATRDAHTLYERNGFAPVDPNRYMKRPAQLPEQQALPEEKTKKREI